MRHRPLWVLVAAAAATYPAVALGWCVATLLGTEPAAWRLGLAGHPAALAAVVLVAVGAISVGGALRAATRGLWQSRRLLRRVTDHEVAVRGLVAVAAADVGVAGRLRLVATAEQVAVTAGLIQPYVVVSTGLVESLSAAQLRAVLAHEQSHLRRRDPLRVLLARVLVAHLWFLPVARDLRRRARCGFELAADRYAVRRYGRSVLAGALLRVTEPAATGFAGAGVVARFADAVLLESRISQLESGRPPRPVPVRAGRAAWTAIGGAAFVIAVAGAWVFMVLTCPCEMGFVAASG